MTDDDTTQPTSPQPPEFPPDDPTMSRTPITERSDHFGIGLTIRVESNDPRIRQSAGATFGPALEHPPDTPDVQMRIFIHHVDEAPDFRPRQPLVRSHGDDFWIAASRSSVVSGNHRTGSIFGFVSETVVSNPDYLQTAFLQSAFLQVAQRHSIAAVHSACLAINGRAILLRGDSGSGKSTLAYAALRRGHSLIAEDVIFLRRSTSSPHDITVHGLPWRMHLLPDASSLFPELTGRIQHERSDGRMKLTLLIADLFPNQTCRSAPLGPLVFVERAHRPTPRLTTLAPHDALTRLAQTAIHFEHEANVTHGIWNSFLATPTYLLETCDSPDLNAQTLESIPTDPR